MGYSECFTSGSSAVVEKTLAGLDLDLEGGELACFVLDFEESGFEFFKLIEIILNGMS